MQPRFIPIVISQTNRNKLLKPLVITNVDLVIVCKICIPNKVTIIKDFIEHFEERLDDSISVHHSQKAIELERSVNQHYTLLCYYVLLNAKLKDDE